MNWDAITIGLYALALVVNGISWYTYNKNTTADTRKKEGWTSFYKISTIFIVTLLIRKL